ncbi:MAG: hypothetical protein RJB50_1162, partial [Actinomycetota bacterium]
LKVTVKKTDFKDDEILLTGLRLGGSDQYAQSDKVNSTFLMDIISQLGYGDFTPSELSDFLSGKYVGVTTGFTETRALVSGSSTVKDLETMLQLNYLKMTSPRKDPELFKGLIAFVQAQLQNVALKTFVGKSVSNSLASILSSTGSLSDAVRRSYLTSVALNTGVSGLDELQGIIDDIARERKQLESQRTRAGGIADYAKKRLAAAEASANVYTARQAQALRDLGDLLRSEQSRRAKAALEEAARLAKEFTKTKYSNIPAPSTAAGVAVKAALSQIGVTYKFGALSPGVAFDCSGLMVYAWAKAGVSIPRSSRSQYSALTRIPTGAAQPGDLIFTRNPVGHVGMYLGNGQMIAAPRTGDVVKVYAVSWSKVTGVGRPK